MRTHIVIVVAFLASSPVLAVNKCKGPDGKVTYQESACAASEKGETVIIRETKTPDFASSYEATLKKRVRDAAQACRLDDLPSLPEVGWSEEKFLQCSRFGVVAPASKVNVTRSTTGVFKQFVYRDSDVYIYTTNGVVTAVQR